MALFDTIAELEEEERLKQTPSYAYDDAGEPVVRTAELQYEPGADEYAEQIATALDDSLSRAPTFAGMSQAPATLDTTSTGVRPEPDLQAQMAPILDAMPEISPTPPSSAQAPQQASMARPPMPAPSTQAMTPAQLSSMPAGFQAIATPERDRPETAPQYGTGRVPGMSSQDIAAHMQSLGLRGAGGALPSDRRPPMRMPGSYAQALQMDPQARERALSSLSRISPEQRQALQMLPGAPSGPRQLDPLKRARIASEMAKADMYGARGGLYGAQASKLSRLRRGGGGGGGMPRGSEQYSSASVTDLVNRSFERAGRQPPPGLVARAQAMDGMPHKQRLKAWQGILKDIDDELASAGKRDLAQSKAQLQVEKESGKDAREFMKDAGPNLSILKLIEDFEERNADVADMEGVGVVEGYKPDMFTGKEGLENRATLRLLNEKWKRFQSGAAVSISEDAAFKMQAGTDENATPDQIRTAMATLKDLVTSDTRAKAVGREAEARKVAEQAGARGLFEDGQSDARTPTHRRTNKRTGEVQVSYDGGKTWEASAGS
jgi:hypothetical protein